MAELLWNRLCNKMVDLSTILPLYSGMIPMMIRQLCAPWIEQRMISDQFNGSDKQVAIAFCHHLAAQLHQSILGYAGNANEIIAAANFYEQINVSLCLQLSPTLSTQIMKK